MAKSPRLSQEEWNFVNEGNQADQNPNYLCTITCTDQNIQVVANLPDTFNTDIAANYEEAFAQAVNNTGIAGKLGGKLRALGVQLTTQALTAQVWQGAADMSFSLPLVFQAVNDEFGDVLDKLEALYNLTLPGETFSNGFLTAPGPTISPQLLLKNVGAITSGAMNNAGSLAADASSSVVDTVTGLVSSLGSGFSSDRTLASSNSATSEASPTNSSKTTNSGVDTPLIASIKNNISLQIGRYMYLESVVITSVGQTHFVNPVESGVMSRVEVTVGFKTFYVPTKKDIPNIFRNAKLNRVNTANGGNARAGNRGRGDL